MAFDKNTSPIAITIPKFKLLNKVSRPFEGSYNEPYIVSLFLDAKNTAAPAIGFNISPFVNVAAGDTVTMLGDGHLVYGPENPGEFLAVSILFMESNSDIRAVGDMLTSIIQSEAVNLGIAAIILANPGAAGIAAIVKELSGLVSKALSQTSDTETFRIDGVFLRDSNPPFDIDTPTIASNYYIEATITSISLNPDSVLASNIKMVPLTK